MGAVMVVHMVTSDAPMGTYLAKKYVDISQHCGVGRVEIFGKKNYFFFLYFCGVNVEKF